MEPTVMASLGSGSVWKTTVPLGKSGGPGI